MFNVFWSWHRVRRNKVIAPCPCALCHGHRLFCGWNDSERSLRAVVSRRRRKTARPAITHQRGNDCNCQSDRQRPPSFYVSPPPSPHRRPRCSHGAFSSRTQCRHILIPSLTISGLRLGSVLDHLITLLFCAFLAHVMMCIFISKTSSQMFKYVVRDFVHY